MLLRKPGWEKVSQSTRSCVHRLWSWTEMLMSKGDKRLGVLAAPNGNERSIFRNGKACSHVPQGEDCLPAPKGRDCSSVPEARRGRAHTRTRAHGLRACKNRERPRAPKDKASSPTPKPQSPRMRDAMSATKSAMCARQRKSTTIVRSRQKAGRVHTRYNAWAAYPRRGS